MCERLSKNYGGVVALDEVSLEFPMSGIVSIIGPNGSGKSTLLDVISGACQPDLGCVYIGGHKVSGQPVHRIA